MQMKDIFKWLIDIDIQSQIAQKMKFSIKDFFTKYDRNRRKLWVWSLLLKKFLVENFTFCAVTHLQNINLESKFDKCCGFILKPNSY